ncbi:hypothetical protein AHAS_Ahas09G0152900 [Arachis hypogaea]
MEFTSSFNQTNFMGYYPLSQYDSSHYSNDGWEYHQEDTNSEHSNPWRFASEPQDEQENHEGYQPPPQNDSYHYPHGKYNDSHSNYLRTLSLDCAAKAYLEECSSTPQNNPHSDEFNNQSNYGWDDQNQAAFNSSYSTYQEISSLEQTFNSFMESCPTSPSSSTFNNSSSPKYVSTQTSTSQRFSELESRFNRLVEEQHQSRRELEILSHETEEQLENTEKRLERLSKEMKTNWWIQRRTWKSKMKRPLYQVILQRRKRWWKYLNLKLHLR